MLQIARTRADVDIRTAAKSNANILDRLPGDCPVEIIAEVNDWFKVKPERLVHGHSGYLPDIALAFPVASRPPVFPEFQSTDGDRIIYTVPNSLKVKSFLKWLSVGDRPDWIKEPQWLALSKAQQAELIEKMRLSTLGAQTRWTDWLAGLAENRRADDAIMKEWVVLMEGGRDVYAIRDHYVYNSPAQDVSYYGCALKGQILRWTGAVRQGEKNGKVRNFYEVDFYRMSRIMHGWFRSDIVAEYQFPSPDKDPTIEINAQTVFDLSKPVLKIPADSAIQESRKKGYLAAQYIDIHDAFGKPLVHFSLCGEFCVAALSTRDVIPLLTDWVQSKYWRVHPILSNPNEGTCAADLQYMLEMGGLSGEIYSSIPTSPYQIKERLDAGQFAIVGCGISSSGKVKADGKIRHWVVLEDILPIGNSGWVRVYNPFQNREEVYNYNMFIASSGVGAGLWVTPANYKG